MEIRDRSKAAGALTWAVVLPLLSGTVSAQSVVRPGPAGPDRISSFVQGLGPEVRKTPGTGAEESGPTAAVAELIANNDGSVTLVAPHLKGPGGVVRTFGAGDDLGAVCRRFGYGQDQAAAYGQDEDGASRLDLLACAKGAPPPAGGPLLEARVAEHYRSKDETVLVRPFVAGPKGWRIPINAEASDYDGVCRYFGYSRAVDHHNEMASWPARSVTAAVCADGRLCGFPRLEAGSRYLRLTDLVCRH